MTGKSSLSLRSPQCASEEKKEIERLGSARREDLVLRRPRVQYSLTDEGLQVARLGEPVFLYLRLIQGLLSSRDRDAACTE